MPIVISCFKSNKRFNASKLKRLIRHPKVNSLPALIASRTKIETRPARITRSIILDFLIRYRRAASINLSQSTRCVPSRGKWCMNKFQSVAQRIIDSRVASVITNTYTDVRLLVRRAGRIIKPSRGDLFNGTLRKVIMHLRLHYR